MKKIIIYIAILICICFIIPIIFTSKFKSTETVKVIEEKPVNNIENNTYEYKQYNKVKLLHVKTNKIEELDLDTYLYGVVSSEMPANFQIEALKAQAIVARTYTIYKILNNNQKHGEAQICDAPSCCQAWITKEDRLAKWKEDERQSNWDRILEAVNSTKGKIVTYNNQPINAFFHSNSGGMTETPINVWGGSGYPYLQAVQTAGEDTYSQYSSEVDLTKEQLYQKVKEKYKDVDIDWNAKENIKILEYTESGRIKTIKIGNKNLSGVEARTIFGLKSANFEMNLSGDNIKFNVKGYGHGVGMSQTGADSMAKSGKNYEEIIKHFYTGVEIKKI